MPIGRVEVNEVREWYYSGGWTRDLGILPRDGQTDRTWHLLFTYPLDARARVVKLVPAGIRPATTTDLPMTHGRSDLQWLHLSPWRDQFGDEVPWGFSLRADGPVAPAVTTAEFEPWSQAMPGGMDAGNLVSNASERRESWLGVAYHGGADDMPTDWFSAWQVFNPGSATLVGTLSFHTENPTPIVHRVTVPAGQVTRVSGAAVPGLPVGRPFIVRIVADRPFAAHSWIRVRARGVPTIRALSASAGVAIQLAPDAVVTDGATAGTP